MKKIIPLLSRPVKRFVDVNFLTIKKDQNISDVYAILKKKSNLSEVMDYIYVINNNKNLIGVFSIKDIFRFPSITKVESFMQTKLITASINTEIEKVAHIALKHGIKAVPIIEKNKIIGVVPNKNIIEILNKSVRKDTFHFAGIHHSHLDYDNTMDVPIMKSVAHRVPWLIGGLIGILATAAFIGIFKNTLEKNLILAFFIPVIVYMTDALGTQVETLLVRDLAVMGKDFKIKNYFIRQVSISVIIALMISAVLFITVNLFWQDKSIASIISLATFLSLTVNTLIPFGIILGIKKMGGDPALGGGPFATVLSDASSIIIYLFVANAFL